MKYKINCRHLNNENRKEGNNLVIKFSGKTNTSGQQYQLEIDTAKKQFKYGFYLFVTADVKQLTKKQLEEIVQTLIWYGYKKENS